MSDPVRRITEIHRILNGSAPSPVRYDGLVDSDAHRALPEPHASVPMPLSETLLRRRSGYRYDTRPLAAEALSTLLRWAAGPQRTVTLPDGSIRRMRTAPSAGGLDSLEVHVMLRPGHDVPAGIHRWDDGRLVAGREGDPVDAWRDVLVQPEFADRVPAILAVVARLDTTLVKYPIRHYRTLHVDAGIVAQNLSLVATALELSCCVVTGFFDEPLARLLRLPEERFPVLLLPVGHAPG